MNAVSTTLFFICAGPLPAWELFITLELSAPFTLILMWLSVFKKDIKDELRENYNALSLSIKNQQLPPLCDCFTDDNIKQRSRISNLNTTGEASLLQPCEHGNFRTDKIPSFINQTPLASSNQILDQVGPSNPSSSFFKNKKNSSRHLRPHFTGHQGTFSLVAAGRAPTASLAAATVAALGASVSSRPILKISTVHALGCFGILLGGMLQLLPMFTSQSKQKRYGIIYPVLLIIGCCFQALDMHSKHAMYNSGKYGRVISRPGLVLCLTACVQFAICLACLPLALAFQNIEASGLLESDSSMDALFTSLLEDVSSLSPFIRASKFQCLNLNISAALPKQIETGRTFNSIQSWGLRSIDCLLKGEVCNTGNAKNDPSPNSISNENASFNSELLSAKDDLFFHGNNISSVMVSLSSFNDGNTMSFSSFDYMTDNLTEKQHNSTSFQSVRRLFSFPFPCEPPCEPLPISKISTVSAAESIDDFINAFPPQGSLPASPETLILIQNTMSSPSDVLPPPNRKPPTPTDISNGSSNSVGSGGEAVDGAEHCIIVRLTDNCERLVYGLTAMIVLQAIVHVTNIFVSKNELIAAFEIHRPFSLIVCLVVSFFFWTSISTKDSADSVSNVNDLGGVGTARVFFSVVGCFLLKSKTLWTGGNVHILANRQFGGASLKDFGVSTPETKRIRNWRNLEYIKYWKRTGISMNNRNNNNGNNFRNIGYRRHDRLYNQPKQRALNSNLYLNQYNYPHNNEHLDNDNQNIEASEEGSRLLISLKRKLKNVFTFKKKKISQNKIKRFTHHDQYNNNNNENGQYSGYNNPTDNNNQNYYLNNNRYILQQNPKHYSSWNNNYNQQQQTNLKYNSSQNSYLGSTAYRVSGRRRRALFIQHEKHDRNIQVHKEIDADPRMNNYFSGIMRDESTKDLMIGEDSGGMRGGSQNRIKELENRHEAEHQEYLFRVGLDDKQDSLLSPPSFYKDSNSIKNQNTCQRSSCFNPNTRTISNFSIKGDCNRDNNNIDINGINTNNSSRRTLIPHHPSQLKSIRLPNAAVMGTTDQFKAEPEEVVIHGDTIVSKSFTLKRIDALLNPSMNGIGGSN